LVESIIILKKLNLRRSVYRKGTEIISEKRKIKDINLLKGV